GLVRLIGATEAWIARAETAAERAAAAVGEPRAAAGTEGAGREVAGTGREGMPAADPGSSGWLVAGIGLAAAMILALFVNRILAWRLRKGAASAIDTLGRRVGD